MNDPEPAEEEGPTPPEPARSGPAGEPATRPVRALRWAVALVRANPVMAVLVAAGVALRGLYMVTYWPAFFVNPDSHVYVDSALTGRLDPSFPFGYSVLLAVLAPVGRLGLVSLVQHGLGLATAVALYALGRRLGLAGWLAAAATVPVLLDPWQISLEHYVMADTLFTALLVAAFVTLLWRPRPGVARCLAAGGLLAVAGLTRTVGLPLLVLVAAFLLVRRVGWRPVAAFTAAAALPVVAYAVAYQAQHGVFGLGENTPRRYYGRAAQIVDCDRLTTLTATERRLCPPEPRSQRRAPDEYGLFPDSPAAQFAPDDPVFASFADKVFRAQPGDLVGAIARDLSQFVRFGSPSPRNTCLNELWVPTSGVPELDWCFPHLASRDGFSPDMPRNELATPSASVGTRAAKAYTTLTGGRTPPWSLVLAVLLVLAATVRRVLVRDAAGTNTASMLLLAGSALALLVGAVAGAMFDVRYALPAIPLLWLAGALAARDVSGRRHQRGRQQ